MNQKNVSSQKYHAVYLFRLQREPDQTHQVDYDLWRTDSEAQPVTPMALPLYSHQKVGPVTRSSAQIVT